MNESGYGVDYFIEFFSNIPEDKWCTNTYSDEKGSHCAYGHCGMEHGFRPMPHKARALNDLFMVYLGVGADVVNDGQYCKYLGDSPKKRILSALQEIKNKVTADA